MANYLLLRNNKESGPYSLDDLMELGLKAYDLIWVQGRSAAWRYPSEVDELKPIAPAVEEQPFDRFYKKPENIVAEKKIEVARQEIAPVAESKYEKPVVESKYERPVEEPKYEKPVVEPQYEKYIPKKSVYVTMPGQKSAEAKQPVKEEPVTPAQPTIMVSENPAAAQIKYSQPLDEIKEMYVKTLHDRKQKIARKTFWLQNMKKIAAVLALVAVGAIVGFVIKSNNGKQAVVALAEKPSQPQAVKTVSAGNDVTDTIVANPVATSTEPVQQAPLHQPTGGYVNKLPERQNTETKTFTDKFATNKPASDALKKEISFSNTESKPVTSFLAQGLEADPVTGERSRKVRTVNSETVNTNPVPDNNRTSSQGERKSSLPGDVANLVSVKSNDYKKVAFGGIRDLQLTVTNDSKFILENVIVELQYIKPNELPLKTENIQFTSIAPNAASTVRVPDTNRGIKVIFKITHIKKRQADERVADN